MIIRRPEKIGGQKLVKTNGVRTTKEITEQYFKAGKRLEDFIDANYGNKTKSIFNEKDDPVDIYENKDKLDAIENAIETTEKIKEAMDEKKKVLEEKEKKILEQRKKDEEELEKFRKFKAQSSTDPATATKDDLNML